MKKARIFQQHAIPARAGVGLEPEHYQAIVSSWSDVGWFEIHAENYLGVGGAQHRRLAAIRECYPLSMHGIGLSIGGPRALDRDHLHRIKRLVDRYEPAIYSEHLAWSTHDSVYYTDLLPIPYDGDAVDRVCDHVDQIQEALQRPILLENPSTYVMFLESTMSEIEFLAAVAQRTGCGLLLDVKNVRVSAASQRWDPMDYVNRFPMHLVGEIHLAGHACNGNNCGEPLVLDAHERSVDPWILELYERAIEIGGAVPTLLEWDSDVPAWPVLVEGARRVDAVLAARDFRFALAV